MKKVNYKRVAIFVAIVAVAVIAWKRKADIKAALKGEKVSDKGYDGSGIAAGTSADKKGTLVNNAG